MHTPKHHNSFIIHTPITLHSTLRAYKSHYETVMNKYLNNKGEKGEELVKSALLYAILEKEFDIFSNIIPGWSSLYPEVQMLDPDKPLGDNGEPKPITKFKDLIKAKPSCKADIILWYPARNFMMRISVKTINGAMISLLNTVVRRNIQNNPKLCKYLNSTDIVAKELQCEVHNGGGKEDVATPDIVALSDPVIYDHLTQLVAHHIFIGTSTKDCKLDVNAIMIFDYKTNCIWSIPCLDDDAKIHYTKSIMDFLVISIRGRVPAKDKKVYHKNPESEPWIFTRIINNVPTIKGTFNVRLKSRQLILSGKLQCNPIQLPRYF